MINRNLALNIGLALVAGPLAAAQVAVEIRNEARKPWSLVVAGGPLQLSLARGIGTGPLGAAKARKLTNGSVVVIAAGRRVRLEWQAGPMGTAQPFGLRDFRQQNPHAMRLQVGWRPAAAAGTETRVDLMVPTQVAMTLPLVEFTVGRCQGEVCTLTRDSHEIQPGLSFHQFVADLKQMPAGMEESGMGRSFWLTVMLPKMKECLDGCRADLLRIASEPAGAGESKASAGAAGAGSASGSAAPASSQEVDRMRFGMLGVPDYQVTARGAGLGPDIPASAASPTPDSAGESNEDIEVRPWKRARTGAYGPGEREDAAMPAGTVAATLENRTSQEWTLSPGRLEEPVTYFQALTKTPLASKAGSLETASGPIRVPAWTTTRFLLPGQVKADAFQFHLSAQEPGAGGQGELFRWTPGGSLAPGAAIRALQAFSAKGAVPAHLEAGADGTLVIHPVAEEDGDVDMTLPDDLSIGMLAQFEPEEA